VQVRATVVRDGVRKGVTVEQVVPGDIVLLQADNLVFFIRTRGNPLASRPHPALVAGSLAVVIVALALPFTTVGRYFSMPPPPAFYGILAALAVAYLLIAETARRLFYAQLAPAHR
jgi:magnesium-transporting ATPase (P-type)